MLPGPPLEQKIAKHYHPCANLRTKCDPFFGIKNLESRHKLPVKDRNNILQAGWFFGLKMSLKLKLPSFR